MSDSKKSASNHDDMIAALAEEYGLLDDEAETQSDEEATPSPSEKKGKAKKKDKSKEKSASKEKPAKDKGGKAKKGKAAKPKAKPKPLTPEEAAAAIFHTSGGDDSLDLSVSSDPYDLDEGLLAEQQDRRRTGVYLVVTMLAVLAVAGGILYYFLQERLKVLAAAEIEPESWLEVVRDFDIHQEDIKAYKARKVAEAQRAKTPIYGNLKLDSEPNQAFVIIDCLPKDEHCNNAGTKAAPRWESRFVKDEEIGNRKCLEDKDCRECKPAPAPKPGEPPVDPNSLCRFPDAKCAGDVCRLPMKTSITIQSLYVGTLAELQKDRVYRVRVQKPGWLTETFDMTAKDWDLKMNPTLDSSDRVAVRKVDLKPDPDAPEELRKQVEEYLRKKAEDEAAMMQEMEKWKEQ